MADRISAERACKEPNPIIDGRKANVNLAILGAKPRGNAVAAAAAAGKLITFQYIPNCKTFPWFQTFFFVNFNFRVWECVFCRGIANVFYVSPRTEAFPSILFWFWTQNANLFIFCILGFPLSSSSCVNGESGLNWRNANERFFIGAAIGVFFG